MAVLTTDEMQRIRRELADNVTDLGAAAYIGHRNIYTVIQANVSSSAVAATTSSTTVAASGPAVLTLATTTGINAGDKLVVDCDAARETVTARAILVAGAAGTVSVVCRRTHSGTYPVEVESGLTLVRGCLSDLAIMQDLINDAAAGAGVKRVDEVEFFGRADGGTTLDELRAAQLALRTDLARMCGLGDMLLTNSRRGAGLEVY